MSKSPKRAPTLISETFMIISKCPRIDTSNGLDFSPGGKTLYVFARCVFAAEVARLRADCAVQV
jgi:hypothetical protein